MKADPDPTESQDLEQIEDLIQRAKTGDREAFGRLYHHYVRHIYRFVASRAPEALVEDFVAETFVRALRSIERFESRGADMGAWLVRIARNLIVDHGRSALSAHEVLVETLPDDGTDDTEPQVMSRLEAETVRRALAGLSDSHASVLRLRYLEDRTATEAAEAMGRTPGAVRVLQSRALGSFREVLEDEAPELIPV